MKSSLIILACFLWAFDALVRYPLMEAGYSSLTVVSFEHFFGLGMLSIFYRQKFRELFKFHYFVPFLVIGGFGSALATLAFTKSFEVLNPSYVILLQKLQPLVAILLASIVLGEKIHSKFLMWAGVSIIGAILIGYEDLYEFMSSDQFNAQNLFHEAKFAGYVYVIISIMGWASATVYGKKLTNMGLDESSILLGRFFFGSLMLFPFCFQDGYLSGVNIEFTIKVVALVFFSGLLAISLYYKGLKHTPARIATLLELFFPFCAVFVNWIILDQKLGMLEWLGGGLLAVSAVVLQRNRY